ncbi:MAG: hypothetical protein R3B51_00390 [Thermodesulfobacteriota bacterium]
MREFLRGFRILHFAGPAVTVFGSARTKEGHPAYEVAREIGGELAKMGFSVMTGGGGGIMEAANRGAKEAGGTSIGCNILLPMEQRPNPTPRHNDKFPQILLRKEADAPEILLRLRGFAGAAREPWTSYSKPPTLIQTKKIY